MSSANPKDFLSAFYDREASPEEEAAARALVKRAPEAKREVQEYGRLTRLIQEAPGLSVPSEFAAAVMQRAERESLIPLDSVAPASAPRRRPWVLAFSAAVSVAAVALIAVSVFNWPAPKAQNVAFEKPAISTVGLKVGSAPEPRKELVAAKDVAPRGDFVAKPGFVAKNGPEAGRPSAIETPFGLEMNRAKKGEAGQAAPAPAPASAAAGPAMILPGNLKTAKVGDVVEALQQDGEQVAVVRLTVVNQIDGLDGVQNILVRNTSTNLQNVDEIRRMRQRFAGEKSAVLGKQNMPGAVGDMICVYVEGSRDEMLNVLEGLQYETHIQKAELTNSIAFSTLEQFAGHAVPPAKQSGKQERDADKERTAKGAVAQSPAPKVPSSQLAVSLPASTVNKILSARQSMGTRQLQSPPLVAKRGAEQLAPVATATDTKAPGQKVAESGNQKSKDGPDRNLSDVLSLTQQNDRLNLRKLKDVVANQKSFQIFFVITDQNQPDEPPASAKAATADEPASQTAAGQQTPADKTPAKAARGKAAPPNSAPVKPTSSSETP